MIDNDAKESIKKWNALPELKCNHCGLVFKGDHQCDYEKLKKDIKRLREALVFYANSENYQVNVVDQWGPEMNILTDGGNKAKKALEDNK